MLENTCSRAIRLGWFPMPYYLFDLMAEISDAELRLLICVLRYTLGWHRDEASLAHSLVSDATGLHQTSIRRALVALQGKSLLEVTQKNVNGRTLNVFEPVLPEEVRRTLPKPFQKGFGVPKTAAAPDRRGAQQRAARVPEEGVPADSAPTLIPESPAPVPEEPVPESREAEPEPVHAEAPPEAPVAESQSEPRVRQEPAMAMGAVEGWSPCFVHGDPMHKACHVKNRPSYEGKKKQQHRHPRPRLVATGAPVATKPTHHPAAVPSDHDLTEEQRTLLERMRAIGVGLTTAVRMLRERPPEIVRRALDHLPMRRAQRPAALLVRELQEGGWETPPEIVAEQERQKTESARRAREAERLDRERQEVEAVEERYRAAWEALPEARRAEAVAEARRRTAWAAHLPGATDPEGPLLRGMVREVVAEWCGLARAEGAPALAAGSSTGRPEARGRARAGTAVDIEAA